MKVRPSNDTCHTQHRFPNYTCGDATGCRFRKMRKCYHTRRAEVKRAASKVGKVGQTFFANFEVEKGGPAFAKASADRGGGQRRVNFARR